MHTQEVDRLSLAEDLSPGNFQEHFPISVNGGRVLEVGAGQEIFLGQLRGLFGDRNWENKSLCLPLREYNRRLALHYLEILECANYVGIELSENYLQKAREELAQNDGSFGGRVELLRGDGRNLQFPDSSFDLVIFCDVLSNPTFDWCMGDCNLSGSRPLAQPHFGSSQCDAFFCECECHEVPGGSECEDCGVRVCEGGVGAGCPDADKFKMIDEAIRVLRPGGHLLTVMSQTPEFAGAANQHLRSKDVLIQKELVWCEREGGENPSIFFGSIEIAEKK